VTCRGNVGGASGRRLFNVGAGTCAGSVFWRKRSPEREENTKLVVKRIRYVGSSAKKRDLPRGNWSGLLRVGRADLLPLLLLRCVGLGLHASLPSGTSDGGRRSLVQRGGIDNHVRDS
jgi:hypothetical protein